MAYDERLAGRIRELMAARPGVVERTMFGGVGWMIGGNMAVGVMRETELVVRIEPEETEAACREPHVHEFGRPGRKPMKGFVVIPPAVVADDKAIGSWVEKGLAVAGAMPPKESGARKKKA